MTPIRLNYFWEANIQLVNAYSGVDELRGQILSSDTSNPCKVFTKNPHGLSNGRVCIIGHQPNQVLNGNQTIVVTGVDNFTVTGISGQKQSGATGIVAFIIDASNYTDFAVTVKKSTVGSELKAGDPLEPHPACVLTWNDQSHFDFNLSFEEEESAYFSWQSSPICITLSWKNELGEEDAEDILVFLTNTNAPLNNDMIATQRIIRTTGATGTGGALVYEALTPTIDANVFTTSKLPRSAVIAGDGSAVIAPDEFSVTGQNVTYNDVPVNPFAIYTA